MHLVYLWFRARAIGLNMCDHACPKIWKSNIDVVGLEASRKLGMFVFEDVFRWGSGLRKKKLDHIQSHPKQSLGDSCGMTLQKKLGNLEKPSLCSLRAFTTDLSHSVVDRICSQENSGTGSCQGIEQAATCTLFPLDCLRENSRYIKFGLAI